MNERELEPTIRRILVALDASPHSQAALEAASDLADALKAELVGIFVEDVNLFERSLNPPPPFCSFIVIVMLY